MLWLKGCLLFYQVPDRLQLQPKISRAISALQRAAAGLPEEWTYMTCLGKLQAKSSKPLQTSGFFFTHRSEFSSLPISTYRLLH